MSNNQMKIPGKIKVGYQARQDTYTGKLAYVTYYDENGVLRKEKSWTDWCDAKQGVEEYPNEPTNGFVLNKKVGDYKYDWNHRMAHIRVYDPRGFEIEISVDNLLYILQECTSTKGKGLEGDFVYAWDGTNLVLLPVGSQEYKTSREFTDGLSKKVEKSDVKEGCIYITKKQETVMYLGRHECFDVDVWELKGGPNIYDISKAKKRHVFLRIDPKEVSAKFGREGTKGTKYLYADGFKHLSAKVDDLNPTYADEFEAFKKSIYGHGFKAEFVSSKNKITAAVVDANYYCSTRFVNKNGKTHLVEIHKQRPAQRFNLYNWAAGLSGQSPVAHPPEPVQEQEQYRMKFIADINIEDGQLFVIEEGPSSLSSSLELEKLLNGYDFVDLIAKSDDGEKYNIDPYSLSKISSVKHY